MRCVIVLTCHERRQLFSLPSVDALPHSAEALKTLCAANTSIALPQDVMLWGASACLPSLWVEVNDPHDLLWSVGDDKATKVLRIFAVLTDEATPTAIYGASTPLHVESTHREQPDDLGNVFVRQATFLDAAVPSPSVEAHLLRRRSHRAEGTLPPWSPENDSGQHSTATLRIFLIRHGESEGNVDRSIYRCKPDHALNLTARGRWMAEQAGNALRERLKGFFQTKHAVDHHIRMFVSPFARTRETAEVVLGCLNTPTEQWVDSVRESTLLSEQDWGALEGEAAYAQKYTEELARNDIKLKHGGRFWSRQPGGESSFDVCQRISAFFPDVLLAANTATNERQEVRTVIVVSHGVTIRAFQTMWCRYSPEWFGNSRNPPNCSIALLEGVHDRGYIYGGFDGASQEPIPTADLVQQFDPMYAHWSRVLKRCAEGPAS